MLAQAYYVIRSRRDGRHLVARPSAASASGQPSTGFLLLFQEKTEAMSYLNTHAGGMAPQFAIESLSREQLASVIKRLEFQGVGIVRDPLVPQIEFLVHE